MLCQEGLLEKVLKIIREYWGSMWDRSEVAFWEEFDPAQTGSAQYGMYGDKETAVRQL